MLNIKLQVHNILQDNAVDFVWLLLCAFTASSQFIALDVRWSQRWYGDSSMGVKNNSLSFFY